MWGRKMDIIYDWIRSLVSYMILMTMIMNLLPDKKYEKYLRLFTGMVFLLLVFAPFADLTGVEAQMAGAFERITFQTDVKLLKKEIEDSDGKRMQKLVKNYETMVEQNLQTMADGIELECVEVAVVLEENMESADFGAVRQVAMRLRSAGDEVAAGATVGSRNEDWAEMPVRSRFSANQEIAELRTRIGEYYGLEERNITIDLETE